MCIMCSKYMCVFADRHDKASVHYVLPVYVCLHWQTWQGQCALFDPSTCVSSLTDMTEPVCIKCSQYMCVFTDRHHGYSVHYVLPLHMCLHWQTLQNQCALCAPSTCVSSLTYMTGPLCSICFQYMCIFTDRHNRASVHCVFPVLVYLD